MYNSSMTTTLAFEDAEATTGGAEDLEEAEEDRHAVTSIVTRTGLVRLPATSVVPQLRVIRLLLRFRISRAEQLRTVPPEN